ncbi:DUF1963 domain-containing protein [Lentzea sp. NPDC059081]|uniref:DUF1963 domain-containing protein n=1 Tax=Lentzea sp. NPDC059081 TaxID=3346719 RepID=UPI00368DC78B
MSGHLRERLRVFREKAAARGFSTEEIERWAAVARPSVRLELRGDGPVVGRFGGPLLLPPDVPDQKHPFVASLDLAALPAAAAGLPLPDDGHLLLFAFPEDDNCDARAGSAVYVPAGTPVVERDKHFSWWSTVDEYRERIEQYPQGELRATPDVTLPGYCDESYPADWWEPEWPPHSAELLELVRELVEDEPDWGAIQLGGYADEEGIGGEDPLESVIEAVVHSIEQHGVPDDVSRDPADWVLLADWHTDVEGWEGATVHWGVQREDLVARRFDRVFVTRYWNP